MRVGLAPRFGWGLKRVLGTAAALVIGGGLLGNGGCQGFGTSSAATACSFPASLVLVPVVCVHAEPTRLPGGLWSYPASNPEAARLRTGSILVVARKSVRRVEALRRDGDRLVLATAAVPLTEVVKDASIPVNAALTPTLTLGKDSFAVGVSVTRQLGPAQLAWKLREQVDDFTLGGLLKIAGHVMQGSGVTASGLRGQARLDWS